MFWMTALLGMVVMGSLDFFSAKPIGKADVNDDTVGNIIDDDLDMWVQKINRMRPYWTMASHIFRPHKHSLAQL